MKTTAATTIVSLLAVAGIVYATRRHRAQSKSRFAFARKYI